MGIDTHGRIKGFVAHEEILNFIRQKYDKNARSDVKRQKVKNIADVTWKHTMNEHSEDNEHWYDISGFIIFKYHEEDRMLFYMYSNVNHLENEEYYEERNLIDMVLAETTYLSLRCWGSSVEIIKEIVAQFGGGWIDENDCDEETYYPIEVNEDKTIKPVIRVTMAEINEKFGGTVVIVDN